MSGNWPCWNVDLLSFINFEDLGYAREGWVAGMLVIFIIFS